MSIANSPPAVSRHAVTFVLITVFLDMVGIGLIILGVFLGGFFMSIERWIQISQNTTNNYQVPSVNRVNPFGRG